MVKKSIREFRTKYQKATIWGELSDALDKHLTRPDILILRDALMTVQMFTGIDMRQEFLLAELDRQSGLPD